MLPSGMNTPWAGSDSYQDFGAQYHSQPDGHARSVHPRVLSVYASTSDFGSSPYTLAATLDTEPLARSYSGGIYPRLSSNHFQFARPPDCDANGVAICVPHVNLWSYIGAGRNATRSWQPLFQCVDLDHGVHDECTEHQAIESYQGYQGPDQNPDGSNRRPRNPERFSLVIADLSEQLTRFRVRSGSICHGDSEFLYASVPSRTTMFNRRRPKTLTVGVG